MLIEITLYSAECDRCGKTFHALFNSENDLNIELNKYNWHDTGDYHFCPDCYTINENDELIVKPIKHTRK